MKGMGHGSDYKQVHRDKQTNKNQKNAWTQHPIYYKKPNRGHFDMVPYFNFDLL